MPSTTSSYLSASTATNADSHNNIILVPLPQHRYSFSTCYLLHRTIEPSTNDQPQSIVQDEQTPTALRNIQYFETSTKCRKAKQFLLFTQLLLKYLALKDHEMFLQAKAIIMNCAKLHRSKTPGYECLLSAVLNQLHQKVGEKYWRRGKVLLFHFCKRYNARKKYVVEALVECKVSMRSLCLVDESSALKGGSKMYSEANDQISSNLVMQPSPSVDLESNSVEIENTARKGSLSVKVCVICSEEYKEGDSVAFSKKSTCNHSFHIDCLVKWLMNHDNCPLCRLSYFDNDK